MVSPRFRLVYCIAIQSQLVLRYDLELDTRRDRLANLYCIGIRSEIVLRYDLQLDTRRDRLAKKYNRRINGDGTLTSSTITTDCSGDFANILTRLSFGGHPHPAMTPTRRCSVCSPKPLAIYATT